MRGYSGARSLAAGDIVIFDRADTWPVGGGSEGFYLTGGVTYIGDSWGAGGRATIRATSGFDAGVIRFRDHSTIPTVFQGFEVDANRQVANGIDINTGYWQLMNGATKRVVNNIVHGVYSQQALGQYRYGIIVSNHGGTAGYAENVEIINNAVYDVSRDAICLYPGDENANTRIRNLLVRGNQAFNTGTDPAYCCGSGVLIKGYVVDAVIEYNYLHNLKGASIFVNSNETNHFGNGPTNIHIRHNVITNETQNGAILVYDGSGGSDPKDLKIYGNIVYNSTVGAGLLLHGGLVGAIQMRVYNNTFFNAPVRVENSLAFYSTFEFTNNVISYAAGTPLSDPGQKVTLHSNNLFFRPGGTLVSSGGTNYTTSTLSAYEPSAIGADPRFKDTAKLPSGFSGAFAVDLAPNADGLAVRPDSPALNSGASLPAPFNTSVNTLTRPGGASWDRGAYESGTSTTSPPSAPTNLRVTP